MLGEELKKESYSYPSHEIFKSFIFDSLESKMNWYSQSPPNSSVSEMMSQFPSFDMTSAQALSSVIDNVNNLIAILRDASDTTCLRTGTF